MSARAVFAWSPVRPRRTVGDMKRNLLIILFMGLVLIAVVVMIAELDHRSRNKFLALFEEHLILHSEYIASRMELALRIHGETLRKLSDQFQTSSMADRRDLQDTLVKGNFTKAVFFCNDKGQVISSTDPMGMSRGFDLAQALGWARKEENRGKIFLSLLSEEGSPGDKMDQTETEPLDYVLMTPVYRDVTGMGLPTKTKFAGLLLSVFDLGELLRHEAGHPNLNSQGIWLMDEDGKVLFHSDHPERLRRDDRRTEVRCTECHLSVAYLEEIKRLRQGTIDYDVRGSKKLADFFPVRFENRSWIVVVSSDYERALAFTKATSWRHFILLTIVVVTLAAGSLLIHHNYRVQVRNQKETRLWKERRWHENMIQEAERKRISQELHDELGQELTALKFRLGFMEKALRDEPGTLAEDCKTARQHTDRIIEDVRRISRELSPAVLENLGLQESLRWLVDEFSRHYHVKATLSLGEIDGLFRPETQVVIYRIFQETLTNVGKHAEATRVIIWVGTENGFFSFAVEDDGKGLDIEERVRKGVSPKGLGLATMMERAAVLGGSVEIKSEKGKGTRVTLTLPVKQEETSEGDLSGGPRG